MTAPTPTPEQRAEAVSLVNGAFDGASSQWDDLCGQFSLYLSQRIAPLIAERDAARAEVERMWPIIEAVANGVTIRSAPTVPAAMIAAERVVLLPSDTCRAAEALLRERGNG